MGTCCGGGIHLSLAAPQQGQPVRLKRGRFLRALKVDFTPQASLRNPAFPLSFSFQQDNQPKKRRRGKNATLGIFFVPFLSAFVSMVTPNRLPSSLLCLLPYPRPVWLVFPLLPESHV